MDSFSDASVNLSNFLGSVKHEAICLPRHQQNSLLAVARQGDEGYETAAKHSARVRINSVSHTADIHLSDPEITL